jgi:pyruvate dehydrogenase E2 component (dihydrolipoamide acetyltransferase)
VPSTASGIFEKVHVVKGGTVSTGDLIATVRSTVGAGAGAQADAGGGAAVGAGAPTSGGASAGDPGGPSSGTASSASGGGAAGASSSGTSGAIGGAAGATAQGVVAPSGAQSGSAAVPAASNTSAQKTSPAGATSGPASVKATTGPTAPATPASSAPEADSQGAPAKAGLGLPLINEPGFSRAHAGPSVRKFARELGVDLIRVKGSGFKGRITHDDVKGFVKTALAGPGTPATALPGARPGGGGLPTIPAVDFAQFGPIETKPLSRIQKISGPRLQASWVNIPHVTQFDEADITDLEATRNRLKEKAGQAGIKLTPLAFIIRACVKALQQFPQFNSSLDSSGTSLVFKKYVHIGFAADTPNGLVVPVVRDADRKDVYKTARELGELSEKARAGKLTPNEMQGGSFTISSLGGIGGTAFTPIINAPEVAILGVSRAAMKPVYRDGNFVPRLMLPLSLSYDHRVIDGAAAARFTTYLAECLANVAGLIEALP